ncbi:MAG: bifunctional diguanylate cyclase/phosphodiesterase [Bryobacteraceae bacterium]
MAALDDPETALLVFDAELILLGVTSQIPRLLELCTNEPLKPQSVHELFSISDLEEISLVRARNQLAQLGQRTQLDADVPASSILLYSKDQARCVRMRLRVIGDQWRLASFEAFPNRLPGNESGELPIRDKLTGLPSRVMFENALTEMLTRRPEVPCAVLRLSLDHLTPVNETLGHAAGNSVIRLAAERLQQAVRASDLVARLDGNEFAVLIHPAPTMTEPAKIATKILDFVHRTYLVEGQLINIGVSVGIARSSDDNRSVGLIRKANLARSQAKALGGAAFCFFDSGMEHRAQADRITELDLRAALPLNQLEVHYQPQVNFATSRLIGFEALVRWRHPQRGLISPGEFIPIAERIGAIVPIGEWVLNTACQEASQWPPDLTVAVNASPSQFDTGTFPGLVRQALSKTGLPGARLEIEVTEGILLRYGIANLEILDKLRSMNVRIAMDDFGTGYSSLSQIALVPFDKIKIDQSLAGIKGDDLKRRAIVRAVVSLGRSLGICVLAEGIETLGQLTRLQQDGCDLVQGYFVSKAVPASELNQIISQWNPEAKSAASNREPEIST